MKKIISSLIIFALISCNSFDENSVLKYKVELNNLVSKIKKYPDGSYHRDDIDEIMIKDLDIDLVIKNGTKKNPSYTGLTEENDSLIIFIKKANNIFDSEKRIIYDFHKIPKNYGNQNIPNASYTIKQLDDRWYYSEEGFD
ncbi:hypothetical protein ACYE2N_13720 [Flavobacterium sp. MAHUQ-51]|uniref:hypothetical protein n=1 Tax=Flavobacterium sp. GCM10022190 TaxID=3252639 RepID=UPI0036089F53